VATAKYGEPGEGEDDGSGDADGEQWGLVRLVQVGGGSVGAGVFGGVERVIGDGDVFVLGDGDGGLEFAGVEAAVGKVVEGDAVFLASGEAEGEGAQAGGLVAAGGDGGGCGDPGGGFLRFH